MISRLILFELRFWSRQPLVWVFLGLAFAFACALAVFESGAEGSPGMVHVNSPLFMIAIFAALGFSFKAILIKLAYAAAPVDAVTLLSIRMIFALPAFLWVGFVVSRSAPPLTRRDWGKLVALGLLGYYGASILDFIGLQYISAGLERLILFTYPTLTVMIGVLFMGKALEMREVISLLLSYCGIGLAFAHDLQVANDMATVLIGGAFVFASSLSYAFYLSGSGPMIQRLGSARFTALAMLVSTLAAQLHFFAVQLISAFP